MSKSLGPTFNVHTFSAAPYAPQNVSYASGSQNNQFSWSLADSSSPQSVKPTTIPSTNGVQPQPPVIVPPPRKPVRFKNYSEEEHEILHRTAERFSQRLSQDHAAVLQPDVDTPFADQDDVLRRLLPYHIYCQPQDDLELLRGNKGKEKVTEVDLSEETKETRFALECHSRYDKLRQRFRKARIRAASRAPPDDQAYILAQLVLDTDRVDLSLLSNELKVARGELERLEREKRAATATAARTHYTSSVPATMTTMHTQYYRPYPYAYTQAYGAAVSPPTTTTFQVNPPPAVPAAARANTAIPVQLPVASLPALHALGIHPVPATSVGEGQAPPPAVLRGSTANGTMLTLEINVSLLQSAQMSGLAMVLNSLMSRTSSGTSGAGSSSPGTSTGATTSSTTPSSGTQSATLGLAAGSQQPPDS